MNCKATDTTEKGEFQHWTWAITVQYLSTPIQLRIAKYVQIYSQAPLVNNHSYTSGKDTFIK